MTRAFIITVFVAGVLAMASATLRRTKLGRKLEYASRFVLALAVLAAVASLAIAGAAAVKWLMPRSTMVTATIVHSVDPSRSVTLRLPRNALSPWFRKSAEEFTSKGMLAFSVSIPYAGNIPVDPAHPRSALALKRRFEQTEVAVRLVGSNVPTSTLFRQYYEPALNAQLVELPPFDGLRAVENRTLGPNSRLASDTVLLFPTHADDLFDVIICVNTRPRAGHFCRYGKRFNDQVSLRVSFVDLRFHGGRKFANERMQLALQKYCEYDVACAKDNRAQKSRP